MRCAGRDALRTAVDHRRGVADPSVEERVVGEDEVDLVGAVGERPAGLGDRRRDVLAAAREVDDRGDAHPVPPRTGATKRGHTHTAAVPAARGPLRTARRSPPPVGSSDRSVRSIRLIARRAIAARSDMARSLGGPHHGFSGSSAVVPHAYSAAIGSSSEPGLGQDLPVVLGEQRRRAGEARRRALEAPRPGRWSGTHRRPG